MKTDSNLYWLLGTFIAVLVFGYFAYPAEPFLRRIRDRQRRRREGKKKSENKEEY